MIPKHMYRSRRAGVAMILLALVLMPGIGPSRWGLLVLCAALVIFGAAALAAAAHPLPEPKPATETRKRPRRKVAGHVHSRLHHAGIHDDPAPPVGPSPSAHRANVHDQHAAMGRNVEALERVFAEVVDIHRGRAAASDDSDVVHVPVLKVAMRPDEKDLRP